jgi:plasmid stabilization system protein ParE
MIVYLPGALRDLRRIARWYRRRRPAYERRFFERLRVTIGLIERAPESFPLMLSDTDLRRARVLRSPYSVAFVVLGGDVHVVAVVHGARSPRAVRRQVRERTRRRLR